MKHLARRALAVLFLLLTLLSSSSCGLIFTLRLPHAELHSVVSEKEYDTTDPAGRTQAELLTFTLSDADERDFYRLLGVCEDLVFTPGADPEEIEEAVIAMEDCYYHVLTEERIAYLLFCMEQDSAEASDRYLNTSELSGRLYTVYNDLCKRIDSENAPGKETFFSDWTDEELAQMRCYTGEVEKLINENERILVKSRALDLSVLSGEFTELYAQTVKNNNRIAELFGYDNYMDYAYETVYGRDYTPKQVECFAEDVRTVAFPACRAAADRFTERLQGMSKEEVANLEQLLTGDWEESVGAVFDEYLDASEKYFGGEMRELFDDGRYLIFTSDENSFAGAFTTYLYDYEHPICYFGKGYHGISTVVHESGHYYAMRFHDQDEISFDLAETQSQGNEWLFSAFASNTLNQREKDTYTDYLLWNILSDMTICTMVDAFERYVYTHADELFPEGANGNAMMKGLENVMLRLCSEWGGEALLQKYCADMNSYWRYVVIESPGYYISYAVSGLASTELYFLAEEDAGAAYSAYTVLAKTADPLDGFLSCLDEAGLHGPFDGTILGQIGKRYEKR